MAGASASPHIHDKIIRDSEALLRQGASGTVGELEVKTRKQRLVCLPPTRKTWVADCMWDEV